MNDDQDTPLAASVICASNSSKMSSQVLKYASGFFCRASAVHSHGRIVSSFVSSQAAISGARLRSVSDHLESGFTSSCGMLASVASLKYFDSENAGRDGCGLK